MLYIDTNVFVFSSIYSGEKAQKAKEILSKTLANEERSITSSLTIDEVVWILWKETKNRDFAISETLKIFEMPNLEIISVTPEMAVKSMFLMQKYKKLKPRDAMHAAACISSGVFSIASDDADFDEIKELTRIKV